MIELGTMMTRIIITLLITAGIVKRTDQVVILFVMQDVVLLNRMTKMKMVTIKIMTVMIMIIM